MISTRHIRHDWKTFVEWNQNSVRTVCGSTTRRGLAGIPGVTDQPIVVEVGNKRKWGWCMLCARSVYSDTVYILKDTPLIPSIRALYDEVANTLEFQVVGKNN